MTEQYAVLAEFYDRLMEDVDYGAWAAFYRKCFEAHGIAPENILDLACGTGNITVPLAEMGYAITGIDRSAEMLSLARKKADERGLRLCLSEQNIACFDAGGVFDAAICSFDGINYLTQGTDASACFARVYETLADGGMFIFDVSTPYKYERILADHVFTYDYDDLFVAWQNDYRKKSGLCDFYLTFFVKGKSGWHRLDEYQRQRCYSLKKIEKMLKEAGLVLLDMVSGIGFAPLAETSERCFFLCRKETAPS